MMPADRDIAVVSEMSPVGRLMHKKCLRGTAVSSKGYAWHAGGPNSNQQHM